MPVMLARGCDAGEHDRGRRRSEREMDDVLRRNALVREHDRQQRHHRHAAADPEEPREKAERRTQQQVQCDQRDIHRALTLSSS